MLDPMEHTVDEWLALAADAERYMKMVGPFDNSWRHYQHQRDQYLRAGIEREKIDKA